MFQSSVLIHKVSLNVPVDDVSVGAEGHLVTNRSYVTEKLADWESTQIALFRLEAWVKKKNAEMWKMVLLGTVVGGTFSCILTFILEHLK